MTESKSVNRVFFITVVLFVAVSYLIGMLPVEIPVSLSLLISQSVVLAPALLYCITRKISIRELIPYRKIRFSTAVLVVVTTYLMYPLMIVLNAISLLFTDSATVQMQSGLTAELNLVLSALLIAVLPACVEEFVFRGVLFQTYRKKRVFSAILLSAFLFGCMHMNFNQFGYAFVLGIYMAFLVEGTGSILSSMLAHFTLNFTGTAVSALLSLFSDGEETAVMTQQTGNFLQGDKGFVLVLMMGIMIWFVISIGTTAGAVAIYIQICKRNGRWESVKQIFQKKNVEKMITIPLILAVAGMIAVMIMNL